jgi:hypothetical protein
MMAAAAVGLAAILASGSLAAQRVLICHLKDHQFGGYSDHVGACTAEEKLAGGRNVTVDQGSLESRHGIT